MFLSKKTVRGISYLQLVKSVHVAGQRNPKKIVVKNYGRYDKLDSQIRAAFEDAQAKKELAKKLASELRMNELSGAYVTVEKEGKAEAENTATGTSNFNKALALHYGHLMLKKIWDRELDLRYKLNYLQEHFTKIEGWNINDLLFYLCSLKVIDPSSYLRASEQKGNFFYCPWADVTQDNFYKVLDFVYLYREDILKHAVKAHLKKNKQQIKVAFFDCTNTYFETPYNDVAWQTIRFVRKEKARLQQEGKTAQEIESYLESEEFNDELTKELRSKKQEVFRMCGPSKEGRFSLPIVTVALAIDQSGFPIDCKVFAGNTSEVKTIHPMLESLKQKYNIKDVYFVADRGLNSTDTLNALKENKLGFVVAQKVSNQKSKEREEMLATDGYRNCSFNELGELILSPEQSSPDINSFRYKVCEHEKTSYIPNNDPEAKTKRKKITVKCKIIYTFSPERRARDLAELDEQIAKASQAVGEQKLMGNVYGTGWRALIKTKKEAAQSKAERDQYRAVDLKEDVIADRKAVAGYAAIVYDDPGSLKEGQFSVEDVLSTYRRLVNIEACFRVMKSTFSIRPVHVRLKERITAHCLLCVLALMLMRSLQMKLEAKNISMSAEQISRNLREALIIPVPSKTNAMQLFLNTGINQNFNSRVREKTGRLRHEGNEIVDTEFIWNDFEQERLTHPDALDAIMQAVELRPLSIYSTMAELKNRLGLKTYSNEIMLSHNHLKYLEKVQSML